MGTTGVGWAPRCSVCWWRRVDMKDSTQDAWTRRVSGDHCGRVLWHMEEVAHTIHRTLLRGWQWRMPCVRRCADAQAMQVQSPCTKIPMDAAGGDA